MRFEESIYELLGVITGIITFAACWGYLSVTYGHSWGTALGWIPALAAGVLARRIWPAMWLALGIFFLFYGNSANLNARQFYERIFNPR